MTNAATSRKRGAKGSVTVKAAAKPERTTADQILPAKSTADNEDDDEDEDEDEDSNTILSSAPAKHLAASGAISADAGATAATATAAAASVIMSKNRTTERRIDEEKIEYKARKLLAREKKELLDKGHTVPADVTYHAELEKQLRKVATRGVVKLFNAIKTHQKTLIETGAIDPNEHGHGKKRKNKKNNSKGGNQNSTASLLDAPVATTAAAKPTAGAAVKPLTKTSFLDLLKFGSSSTAASATK
ncbi:Rrp15p-domain-containing protein [Ramicandelaber brevisporus]|nr:Rrp15p-domain-containing protein [Ramicandelaber brevisporus]KAI8869246.1 Rrp15p-domain-containing protein [Ramicandelaber brevisporus]